jgi:Protein of unknown function (DUF4245)
MSVHQAQYAAREPGAALRHGGWLAARPVLRGGRSVLACLLLSAFIMVAVPLQYAGPPATVSYRHDLATMTRAARYPVVAPAWLPLSWSPVSSAVALGGANGPGTATWHLGFATPSGTLASVEQSDAAPAAFVRRMTNSGTPAPAVRVDGLLWRASANVGRAQRSLYRTERDGGTLIVTGNATWAQLRVLAASLRVQPRR